MSAEENRVLIQRLFKDVLNQGDMGPLDEIISPEHVEHAALPGQDGSGLAGVKLRLATFREAFPDMVWTLEDLVADEEKAVARWSMNATNQGAFMGVAPTGRRNFYGHRHILHCEWPADGTLARDRRPRPYAAAGCYPHARGRTGLEASFGFYSLRIREGLYSWKPILRALLTDGAREVRFERVGAC